MTVSTIDEEIFRPGLRRGTIGRFTTSSADVFYIVTCDYVPFGDEIDLTLYSDSWFILGYEWKENVYRCMMLFEGKLHWHRFSEYVLRNLERL